MAEKDFTTEKWPSMEEIDEVIDALRAIRAIGDLLCMAADTAGQHRATFREDTLAEVGVHLEDLTTEALVILRWEKSSQETKPQAAALSPDSQEDPPKAKNPSWPALPEKVEEDLKQLDRLGDCLSTLAEAQEKMDANTLLVTTDQLRSWALICHHVAMWVPENLCGEVAQEGGAA